MSGDNGVHTFSVTLRTPCTQTVSVKDTALSCVTGTSGDIDVIGPVTHFSVTAPATVVAGVPFVVTVTALDASDAVDTTYVGKVHFSMTDPGGSVPGDYQFVLADNGMHTFSITLVTVDSQMVTVADTALRCVTGTSNDILVTAPNTATPTPSSTPSVTPTHSSTPTHTPVPQGGACMDPAQCAGGLFCSQGVCCDADCAGPNQSCAVPGREGQCVSSALAAAPAMSPTGLLSALATLIAIGALALVTRRRRYRT